MHKKRDTSNARVVVVTTFLSILVLGVGSYLFVSYFMPLYGISMETLYSILTRLLPLVIGLALVQIALILSPSNREHYDESQDDLEKDALTAPLYELPNEDEVQLYSVLPTSSLDSSQVRRVSVTQEKPSQVPQHPIPEEIIPLTIATTQKKQKASIEKQDQPKSTPLPKKATSAPFSRYTSALSQEVTFSSYPYPIEEGSDIASLLEPIERTEPIESSLIEQYLDTVEDVFEIRLESELSSALTHEYEISVARIMMPKVEQETREESSSLARELLKEVGIRGLFYNIETRHVAAILPFYSFEQTNMFFTSIVEKLKKQHPIASVKIGFTSLQQRTLDASLLIHESMIASEEAQEHEGFSVVGFDKYLEPRNEDLSEPNLSEEE